MYESFFINELCEVVCYDCKDNHMFNIIDERINWEDTSLYCSDCENRIVSEYAEKDSFEQLYKVV